jgi:uncharacterized membrane protein
VSGVLIKTTIDYFASVGSTWIGPTRNASGWESGKRKANGRAIASRLMGAPGKQPQPDPHPEMTRILDRNITALLSRRREEDRRKPRTERIADRITAFTGSMHFVYLHLFIFGLWIVINLGWIPFIPRFDPSFVVLAMAASVEAIFLSTFVLITQNRMAAMADQRADLDLQISLLAEHEITRLLTVTTAIAERLGLQESRNPELQQLAKDVRPEEVLEQIERHESSRTE